MNKTNLFLYLFWFFIISSCNITPHNIGKKNILVIPLNDGVTKLYMDSALNMLKNEFPEVNIIIGEKRKLPKNCFNGRRYRADSILLFLDKIKPDSTYKVIGLTSSDISNTRTLNRNGKEKIYKDYGIMGLGRKPGSVCVVSSFRISKIQIWKRRSSYYYIW